MDVKGSGRRSIQYYIHKFKFRDWEITQEPLGCVISVPAENSENFEPAGAVISVLYAQPLFYAR
jgi:hypothetical protein